MDAQTAQRKASAWDTLAALETQDARHYAAKAQALVDMHDVCSQQLDSTQALTMLPLDIATACDIAQSTATMRLDKALRLVHHLPHTYALLQQGRLRVGQALAILEETKDLPGQTSRQIDALAAPKMLATTTGDTRRLVKKIIVKVDAQASEQRRQTKAKERRVFNSSRPDGRAFIGIELSAEDAGGFYRAVSELANSLYGPGDPRTLDQQRADVCAWLPHFALTHLGMDTPAADHPAAATGTGTGPGLQDFLGLNSPTSALTPLQGTRIQAVVLVPVETGLDMADNPGQLLGYGPITAHHARELLVAAELRKACTDRRTGRIIRLEAAVVRARERWGTSSLEQQLRTMIHTPSHVEDRVQAGHDPSPDLAEFLRLRDDRCNGPGCSQPATHCDLDHLQPYPTGKTTADNLGPLSRRCHNAKTHAGWIPTPHPDGSITWTSPYGRTWHRPSRSDPPDLTDLHPDTAREEHDPAA